MGTKNTTDDVYLKNFEMFFTLDNDIKNIIYEMGYIPRSNKDELVKYSDILWKKIDVIRSKYLHICKLFDIDFATPIIDNFIEKCKNRLMNTDYSFNDFQAIYNECFAKMEQKTLDLVDDNIYGYSDTIPQDICEILPKCSSCNELLHTLHCYVIRNQDFLKKINEIECKQIFVGCKVALRGDENPYAKEIYDTLIEQASDLSYEFRFDNIGNTDIVAINKSNKILIMVRDKGHSLTIESKLEQDGNFGVEYYMPKSISYEVVRKLKGFQHSNSKYSFSKGSFLTSSSLFVNDIVDLINSSPTDENLYGDTQTAYDHLKRQK